MALSRRDRFHIALHLAWEARGGAPRWLCAVLRIVGAKPLPVCSE